MGSDGPSINISIEDNLVKRFITNAQCVLFNWDKCSTALLHSVCTHKCLKF